MIGGQYLDTMGRAPTSSSRAPAEDGLPLLRVGRAARSGPRTAGARSRAPWRAFGDELGLLFQIVDDILDEDGYVLERRAEARAALADEAADRAQARLGSVAADTSVLSGIVAGLAARTS